MIKFPWYNKQLKLVFHANMTPPQLLSKGVKTDLHGDWMMLNEFSPSRRLISLQADIFYKCLLLLIWPFTLNSKWRGASKAGWLILGASSLSVAGSSFYRLCPLEVQSPSTRFQKCHIGPYCHRVLMLFCTSLVDGRDKKKERRRRSTSSYCCSEIFREVDLCWYTACTLSS